MIQKDITPTASELEILALLWEKAPQSVKEIYEQLRKKRDIGYTTALKIMQIMASKGILRRETDDKSHLYFPILEKNQTQEKLLDTFLDTAFGGSAANLVMQALGNHKASQAELSKIKELIQQIEKNK
jgi:predicted transcriptional regulator